MSVGDVGITWKILFKPHHSPLRWLDYFYLHFTNEETETSITCPRSHSQQRKWDLVMSI